MFSIERSEALTVEQVHVQERSPEALVQEFDSLARLAFLLSGDQSRAEDAAAEAIARVWQRSATTEIAELRPYLRRTLVNIVTRNRRRFWFEQKVIERDGRAQVPLDSVAVDRMDINKALLLLPSDQRVVIGLRYFEDLSEGAIASMLGIRPGTVKSRASRGLDALRIHMRGGGDD